MPLLSRLLLLLCSSLFLIPSKAATFSSLGVNYGQLGSDLLSPARSIHLLRSLHAGAVKIYDANPSILSALKNSPLTVSVMVPNQLIPSISANQSASDDWIRSNVLPFYSNVRIRYLLVGNEILSDQSLANSTWPHLVPAITRIRSSLRRYHLRKVKVGTTLAMDALSTSFPPSAGQFRPDIAGPVIKPLLRFLAKTRSFYFVDAYPYFPWSQNPGSIRVDYALFEAKSTYVDPGSGLTYTNLLDQMLDAVIFAMKKTGYGSVKLAIAETGWPNGGDLDQIGANVYNAATYNRNLARRMAAKPPIGTPARPGRAMPVFVFALYNEDQKPGPGTERHWGLLYPNGSKVYDVDLTGRKPASAYGPLPKPTNNEPFKGKIWCVLDGSAPAARNETVVAGALTYACGQGNGTCDGIKPGRECYNPNTVAAHASYAFNSYWQQFRKSGGTCYFGGLAVQTAKDPGYGSCIFPSGTN